jgi:hypothetical protein
VHETNGGHGTHPAPAAFPFERKVERWAAALARSLTGAPAPFVLTLGADGAMRSVNFEHPATSWFARANALAESGEPFLFYDPLGGDGHAFITWSGVGRETLERLLGGALTDADFKTTSSDESQAYPDAWDAVLERTAE